VNDTSTGYISHFIRSHAARNKVTWTSVNGPIISLVSVKFMHRTQFYYDYNFNQQHIILNFYFM